ncbi:Ubiquitin-conjugating enzyme E2 Z [Fulvia fulva]|uniref:Ubiquitin-conjugating enzyme E2 Z n=1 Tax=Passalora fulva TaxID=5499 RepID=A0A9Q8L5N4_PASFU|nr:Ubiquitin-conjugating enzyme E2 Z [Fulvia fulva]KAK4635933.1 Ubiquitin-conjugating enzyme E2 Z [Fulvia fulva]KAK4637673.1 Ubiquitin-conjugating enzyme E2 Z [Fulvia fulva]UJO11199.1 Ubiquitin-conjugating enzyme E2 Z [Fulvia fulva]WPV08086.1 Ubiquitin-conjugating enzyme E2 Z [Fulvia fulva]WPV24350.1 Ubiquitin-conjugating enzyme E2 Z [Fulvia fulva]
MAQVNTSGAIQRLTRELACAEKNEDLSLKVAYRDNDVRSVRAMIIGPPDTPYEFGFFEFDMKFPKEYPIKNPHVVCITTNGGRTRFNPNIYAEGKVCLSILGTWRGNPGEEWSSAQGLESVLLSIQSLMSPNPFENEPGYETAKKEEPNPSAYIAKIRHETLRISVMQRMESILQIKPERSEPVAKKLKSRASAAVPEPPQSPPDSNSDAASGSSAYEYNAEATFNALDLVQWDPFADLVKRRFLWYYDSYVRSINKFSNDQKDGAAFKRAEFEFPPNSMEGNFDYRGLRSRLGAIMDKLNEEKRLWEQQGLQQVAQSSQMATQLAFQFKQLQYSWNEGQYSGPRLEVNLPDPNNPFVWQLTLFGEPMSNLDGGIFNMKLHIPPKFPSAQPRVTVETPIFHHRVSSNGNLCYFPVKEDEINSHLQAIIDSIVDDDDKVKYDPRCAVNPESFELRFGGTDKRKIYNRKLRRSAQESSEFL